VYTLLFYWLSASDRVHDKVPISLILQVTLSPTCTSLTFVTQPCANGKMAIAPIRSPSIGAGGIQCCSTVTCLNGHAVGRESVQGRRPPGQNDIAWEQGHKTANVFQDLLRPCAHRPLI
jgi:hypothetical protein